MNLAGAERCYRPASSCLLMVVTVLPFVSMLPDGAAAARQLPRGLAWPSRPQWGNFAEAFTVANMAALLLSSALIVVGVVPVSCSSPPWPGSRFGHLRIPGARSCSLLFVLGLTLPVRGDRHAALLPDARSRAAQHPVGDHPAAHRPLHAVRGVLDAGPLRQRAGRAVRGRAGRRRQHVAAVLAGPRPAARPALASLGILLFLWTWNQFLLAIVLVDDPDQAHDGRRARRLPGPVGTDILLLCAGSLLILRPDPDRLPDLPASVRHGSAAGLRQGMSSGHAPADPRRRRRTASGGCADVFRDNFAARGEVGAAVTVYVGAAGSWTCAAGRPTAGTGRPWTPHTPVVVFSCTKGDPGDLRLPAGAAGPARPGRAGHPLLAGVRPARQGRHPGALGCSPTSPACPRSTPADPRRGARLGPGDQGDRGAGPAVATGHGAQLPRDDVRLAVGEVIRRITGHTPGRSSARPSASRWACGPGSAAPGARRGRLDGAAAARTRTADLAGMPARLRRQPAVERGITMGGAFAFPARGGFVTFNDPRIQAAEIPGAGGVSTAAAWPGSTRRASPVDGGRAC